MNQNLEDLLNESTKIKTNLFSSVDLIREELEKMPDERNYLKLLKELADDLLIARTDLTKYNQSVCSVIKPEDNELWQDFNDEMKFTEKQREEILNAIEETCEEEYSMGSR